MKFSAAFSPGRTFTGKMTNEIRFYDEIERAKLLLLNLKDEDLNWSQPDRYLRCVDFTTNNLYRAESNGELEISFNLYMTWLSIAIQIHELENAEIDPWWLIRLDAAGIHIMERIIPMLSYEDQHLFFKRLPEIHAAMNSKEDY